MIHPLRFLYKVRDWDRYFETSESRKRKHALAWVGMPCKHDGRGFNRLKRHPDWPSIYGAWSLVLQIAAKCPVRGTLADEDGPFTALDIADKVGLPEELVQRCFDLLTDPQAAINWLEVSEIPGSVPQTPADSSTPQQIPADSGKHHPYQTEPDQTEPDRIPDGKSGSGSGEKTPKAVKKKSGSVFDWINDADLHDIGKLIDWHKRASNCPKPVVGKTEQDRLNVVAAAVKCWDEADEPVKLFAWIVGKNRWDFVSQEHEDTAHEMIKQYLSGGTVARDRKGGTSTAGEIVGELIAAGEVSR